MMLPVNAKRFITGLIDSWFNDFFPNRIRVLSKNLLKFD
jgi:hypothetical protein